MTEFATDHRDDTIVAAYTCPLWHASALFAKQYGPGWSEYELMRGARPRAPGHRQPRRPLLGALDEARPETWDVYNSLAAEHGVDALIWDWYWYDGGPALHEALDGGFLGAGRRMRFAIMWVNHHWMTLYPTTLRDRTGLERAFLAPDSEVDVWRGWSTIASRYFHLPQYWRIDGAPVFVVWDVGRMVQQLGRECVGRLIGRLRAHVASLGHADVHVHANLTMALWRAGGDPAASTSGLDQLGFDSCGLYNPLLSVEAPDTGPPHYAELAELAMNALQPALQAASPIPFFPAASPGWDTTPRMPYPAPGEDVYRHPEQGLVLVEGGTPAEFEDLVAAALELAENNAPGRRVVTIGCFNEWTEGQYLLPDVDHGYGMLRALARARGLADDRVYYATTAGDSHLSA
jgi:Glycosyltransferase WbsX